MEKGKKREKRKKIRKNTKNSHGYKEMNGLNKGNLIGNKI